MVIKQKTEYEMRISDWSADVCASDHERAQRSAEQGSEATSVEGGPQDVAGSVEHPFEGRTVDPMHQQPAVLGGHVDAGLRHNPLHVVIGVVPPHEPVVVDVRRQVGSGSEPLHLEHAARSEEHTSELQSLMRISYAVFFLKKKKNHPKRT